MAIKSQARQKIVFEKFITFNLFQWNQKTCSTAA